MENSLIAQPDCISLESDWDELLKNLNMSDSNKVLNISKRITNLKKIYIFKNLSEQKLIGLSKLMKKEKFVPEELIVKEGIEGDKFFLINKGIVRISQNGKTIRELEKGNYFGEISLLRKENRTASVYSVDNSECYSLTKEDFLSIIDPSIIDLIKSKIYLQDTSVLLKELYYIKFLGKGKFGNVSLVHNKENLYAIKAIPRKLVDSQKKLAKYFLSEKRIMQSLDNPFILRFVKSLKNEHFCFFLLEFINGENMDNFLRVKKNIRDIYETKFYIASLLYVVDYLHKKNISHRDIKPCNIMIDKNGYLKVLDFGTSTFITDFTHTIVGTPHYIAPEILIGKGYSLTTDYWSVGICMYEIFYGIYPFGNSANDIMDIYKEIVHK